MALASHHRRVLSADNPPPIVSPCEYIWSQFPDNGTVRQVHWHFVFVQARPPNTCAGYILAEEAERFQSESRTISVLSRLGRQAPVDRIQLIQSDDSLTFGASPDHILTK